MKRLFVTGTDTGVGKTYVTAALARRARDTGRKVFAFKPFETGCERIGQTLLGPDQEILAKAAGDWQAGPLRGLYRFVNPFAPAVAAAIESQTIDLDLITRTVDGVGNVNLLVVEGAGGWRVPITDTEDMSHLARRLRAEVIIAARAGLGTINHTLLTIEAVERDGLKIACVVMSRRPNEDEDFARSNREQVKRRWRGPIEILDTDPRVLDQLLA